MRTSGSPGRAWRVRERRLTSLQVSFSSSRGRSVRWSVAASSALARASATARGSSFESRGLSIVPVLQDVIGYYIIESEQLASESLGGELPLGQLAGVG